MTEIPLPEPGHIVEVEYAAIENYILVTRVENTDASVTWVDGFKGCLSGEKFAFPEQGIVHAEFEDVLWCYCSACYNPMFVNSRNDRWACLFCGAYPRNAEISL